MENAYDSNNVFPPLHTSLHFYRNVLIVAVAVEKARIGWHRLPQIAATSVA